MPSYELPDVKLTEEQRTEISSWLYDQITSTVSARQPLVDLWVEVQKFYEMTELKEKKNFPFEGAAHLMVQIIATHCEQIKAKINGTIWGPSDPFSCRPWRKEFIEFAEPMRKFITWAVKNELKLRTVMDPVILEHLKLGTAAVKVVYEVVDETRLKWNPAGKEGHGDWEEMPFRTIDHPVIWHIPLPDFIFPLETRNIHEAPWLAQRYTQRWSQLVTGERQGRFKEIEKVKSWVRNTITGYESDRGEHGDIEPMHVEEWDIYEIWFEYQLKPDMPPFKLKAQFELGSKHFLRIQYNDYPMQWTPFEILQYEIREHKVYANGVGRIGVPWQKEVSTMHNQRIDAASIRIAPVFKRKADSVSPEFITFKLGSSIPVTEMDDIDVLWQGQAADSSVDEEQHTLELFRERIGIQEFAPDVIGGAQSTTFLAGLAESRGRFDAHISNIRDFLSRVMTKVFLLYQQYYPEGKVIVLQGEDGLWSQVIFKLPERLISEGMAIEVTATTSATSKELGRQHKLSVFGLLSQYYGQLTQYILQAENPQLPESVRLALLQIVDAMSTFVEDILEDYNLYKSGELTISFSELQERVQSIRDNLPPSIPGAAAGMGGVPGAPPGPGGGNGAAPQPAGAGTGGGT